AAEVDLLRLPEELRVKLAELDLELSEGDITQKGYDKKKSVLLKPFLAQRESMGGVQASPSTRASRRAHRRLTRDEGRFHSEIRTEAVQAALAEYAGGGRERPRMLQPIKRNRTGISIDRGAILTNPTRRRTIADSDSSSDDESSCNGSTGRGGVRSRESSKREKSNGNGVSHANGDRPPPPDITNCTAAQVLQKRAQEQQKRQQQRELDGQKQRVSTPVDSRPSSAIQSSSSPSSATTTSSSQLINDDVVYVNTTRGGPEGEQEYQNACIANRPSRVSLRIQQLLNTLQRPRTKPLHEYYNDDDAELEALAKMTDPNAPRAEGATMSAERGEAAAAAARLPRTFDSALQKYATSTPKVVVGTVLDHQGRPGQQLIYSKLLSRANKVAYMLLNKTITVGREGTKVPMCKPGDRVALIYPNTEPLSFMVAFYGCILAGVVPVPVEVPLTKRDAGIQQLGFLLGSCAVKVALTSEGCYKGLPKVAVSSSTPSMSNAPSGSNSLSGHSAEMVDLKGWPRLYWVTTENLSKPHRDWQPPSRVADESVAYIEYSTDREGAVKGVCVSREAMLAHARALATAMDYQMGDTMVCVVDFKREVGLWHAIIASVLCGMRVIFVPYSLMKVNPSCWLITATTRQATTCITKSRDLHWALMAVKEHKEINLSSVRSIVVSDGANPWSLSSCDQFTEIFAAYGLRSDAMCPCAGSSETGTISIRRVNSTGGCKSGRGILSMAALSHSVVRVDKENSLNSLTLQDAGQVVPAGVVVVVKQNGKARLCRADEVGEICLSSHSTGTAYWGLEGVSAATFRVEPMGSDGRPLGPLPYVRSGLLGFMGPDGLVFVVGRRSSQLLVSGRTHSADDIIATVLAVEPMRFVYRGRIAVFSQNVLRDERIVIVAEQKGGVTEEESFEWMSNVLQAIDSIHQVGIYCLALVPVNALPKTPLGGIHVSETRSRFVGGELHPTTLLMCPHACVLNLPKPREQQSDVGPAAIMVGNLLQGARIASAQGRPLPFSSSEEEQMSLLDVLRHRATTNPDHLLYSIANAKSTEAETCTASGLLRKAERVGALLADKARLNPGDHVALIFPPGIELVAAFYGCLSAGVIPVCVRPPSSSALQTTLPTVRMIVDVSKAVAILSTPAIIKLLKSKEALHRVDAKSWPLILDADDLPSAKRRNHLELPERKAGDVCYLDFSVSTTGQLSGVGVSYAGAISICKSLKLACELYPSRSVTLCLDPYSGLAFSLWTLAGVYAGHQTTLIPPSDLETSPALWLSTVSTLKARDTFVSYCVLEQSVKDLASQVPLLKERGLDLTCLRSCVVVAEERPRVSLVSAFSRLFAPLGLPPRALSTSFGCRVNPAICMQGAAGPDPSTVYVDTRALRNDRVTLVGKGAPHSLALLESGKLLPGVRVVIANPETRGQCADSHLGELWVAAPHNSVAYFTVFGEETSLHTDHFNAHLATGDTRTRFARTGYLGFLRQTQSINEDGELHDAVFIVGSLDETLLLRGMRYHPVDMETSISRAHRNIGECAVFTWSHLLVAVVECTGAEQEALNIVPAVTSTILEEHHLIVGVVVIVDPNTVPKNSRGEKQRTLLRETFMKDKLDPIYVAYNM
ncbi:hypothetical protein PMAYCL1PPCAC_24172, partial [Pristionchus mayeri]